MSLFGLEHPRIICGRPAGWPCLTLSWAVLQDWSFNNLVSFRMDLNFDYVNASTFSVLEQLILHLPQVRNLHIRGVYSHSEWDHDWSQCLDLTSLLESTRLRKLWIRGFQLVARGPAAAQLTTLVLEICELTQEVLALILGNSSVS